MAMAWEGFAAALKTDPAGVEAVLRVADAIGARRRELAWSIERESGWNPHAQNPISHAGGLIQFMPGLYPWAKDAAKLTRAEQAPLVARYFRAWRGKLTQPGDVYMVIAEPSALRKPASTVLGDVGSQVWRENPPWRSAGEGPVTAGSIRAFGTPPATGGPPDASSSSSSGGGWLKLLASAAFCFGAYKAGLWWFGETG